MILYNFERIFKARGVDRPFSFLIQAGFSDKFATKIKKNKVKRINLAEIERLCVVLKCTPNDFFEWIPNSGGQIGENHPLNDIRRSEKVIDITKTLNSVPLGQLAEIEQLIMEKINSTVPDST